MWAVSAGSSTYMEKLTQLGAIQNPPYSWLIMGLCLMAWKKKRPEMS